jgi:hypothetical protein
MLAEEIVPPACSDVFPSDVARSPDEVVLVFVPLSCILVVVQ